MLFVDDHKAKRGELRTFGEERMRPNYERRAAIRGRRTGSPTLSSGSAAQHERHRNTEWGQESVRRYCVLTRQQLSRREQCALMPCGRCRGGGNEGNRRLSGADIPLQQAQHRRTRCKIDKNLVNSPTLICGPGCRALCLGSTNAAQDCRFDGRSLARGRLDVECAVARSPSTAMYERNLHCEKFIEREAAECGVT